MDRYGNYYGREMAKFYDLFTNSGFTHGSRAHFDIFGLVKDTRAKGKLMTDGIYKYVRHPQYLGLMLLTIGTLVQWPTIITFAMWPILAVMYYKLGKREEGEMEARFGAKYSEYKQRTPMFIPLINRLRI